MEKEGLQTAIDFTKLLMALAGGGIALIIQPNFFTDVICIKILSIGALIFLSISEISGLFVFSGASVMLANRDYNLDRKHIKIPGLVNVFSFGIGFLFLAVAVALKLYAA